MLLALFLLGWVLCGVLSYGIGLAYFQNEFPRVRSKSDGWSMVALSVAGPAALVVVIIISGFAQHGLQWRPKPPLVTADEECREYEEWE